MDTPRYRWARTVACVLLASVVASCNILPQAGPNKRQIYSGSVQREGDAFIVTVNDRVNRATAVTPALGFSDTFKNAGILGPDIVRSGDTLSLRIWENVDDGLLATEGTSQTALDSIVVDGTGFIFVPYAGRIKAAGNSTEAIRRIITSRLEEQTPDPQVEVVREAGDGATVTIAGSSAAGQGVFPIERPTRTLASMIAQSGGTAVESEIARITVQRSGMTGTIWFDDLFENPELDIPLRPNDKILIEGDTRSYTTLGATAQTKVDFESRNLSALEAIAQVGGLSTTTADPTGVFIFRNEAAPISNSVLGRSDLVGPQRMVYVLNLTQPNGLFLARDFVIRDGDTIYVTEAPYTQFTKIISSISGAAGSVNSLSSVAGTGN